ncbi:unnamed protein product [Cuscuta epithymum]|uniref:Interactor of constitutive active ROPs 2, chloroplastic-like n=1 Tax=Cuscuta epithymum TaxID=186058 RepID=A0AAV0DJV9_9ASTE|nr:unnamed protein product [Cuscuta epithymum]
MQDPIKAARTTSLAPTGRKLKNARFSDYDSASSSPINPNRSSRAPKSRSLKTKCATKVSDLDTRFQQLQEELKKAKEQLSSSESMKKKAQQEAQETKKQLAAMSLKLEESHKQLIDLSDSESSRLRELLQISHDRDRAWESELEALRNQHDLDISAMAEIQKLKAQIHHMGLEIAENLALLEDFKSQLNESKASEAQTMSELKKAEMKLEVSRMTEETLRDDLLKADEAYKSLILALASLKASLVDQETKLKYLNEENGLLKSEIQERVDRKNTIKDEIIDLKEVEIIEEQESMVEEDKITEKPENWEIEDELRKLKVQCNQWRKAAEAAAAILSGESNGKHSMDYHTLGGKLGTPLSDDDFEEEWSKKKNGKVLKKFGILLKKSQR